MGSESHLTSSYETDEAPNYWYRSMNSNCKFEGTPSVETSNIAIPGCEPLLGVTPGATNKLWKSNLTSVSDKSATLWLEWYRRSA